MFRAIDEEPNFVEEAEDPIILRMADATLEKTGFRDYLESAAVHKARYEFELTGLMRRYDSFLDDSSYLLWHCKGTTSARLSAWVVFCYAHQKRE